MYEKKSERACDDSFNKWQMSESSDAEHACSAHNPVMIVFLLLLFRLYELVANGVLK